MRVWAELRMPSYDTLVPKVPEYERDNLSKALMDMRKECEILALADTVDLISFIAGLLQKNDECRIPIWLRI